MGCRGETLRGLPERINSTCGGVNSVLNNVAEIERALNRVPEKYGFLLYTSAQLKPGINIAKIATFCLPVNKIYEIWIIICVRLGKLKLALFSLR